MPKKSKDKDDKKNIKQKAMNIININLDGKMKRKKTKSKKGSTVVKQNNKYSTHTGPMISSGYTPPSLYNPLRPAYNVVTQAPQPPKNDFEDSLKKLIESQTDSLKKAMQTPTPTPTPYMPTPYSFNTAPYSSSSSSSTPYVSSLFTSPYSSSSSTTPGFQMPINTPKQSILQKVQGTNFKRVSIDENSDYEMPFERFQNLIQQSEMNNVQEAQSALQEQNQDAAEASSSYASIDDLARVSQIQQAAQAAEALQEPSQKEIQEQKQEAAPGEVAEIVTSPPQFAVKTIKFENNGPDFPIYLIGTKFQYLKTVKGKKIVTQSFDIGLTVNDIPYVSENGKWKAASLLSKNQLADFYKVFKGTEKYPLDKAYKKIPGLKYRLEQWLSRK